MANLKTLRANLAAAKAEVKRIRDILNEQRIIAKEVRARDRKSTRLNSSHVSESRMPSSA